MTFLFNGIFAFFTPINLKFYNIYPQIDSMESHAVQERAPTILIAMLEIRKASEINKEAEEPQKYFIPRKHIY